VTPVIDLDSVTPVPVGTSGDAIPPPLTFVGDDFMHLSVLLQIKQKTIHERNRLK